MYISGSKLAHKVQGWGGGGGRGVNFGISVSNCFIIDALSLPSPHVFHLPSIGEPGTD